MYWKNFEATYQQLSSEYLKSLPISESLVEFLNEIRSLGIYKDQDEKIKKVLEMGCGTGSFTEYLAQNYNQVVGCDISQTAIKEAQQRLNRMNNVQLKNLNALTLGEAFPQDSFDLVVDSHLLHHLLNQKEREIYFKALKDIVRPQGLILIETPFLSKNNIFTEKFSLDESGILWESIDEIQNRDQYCELKVMDNSYYLPKWRLKDFLSLEDEIKKSGLVIKYFMVLENNKIIPDKDRNYSMLCDPGIVRIVASKE
ncbi:MAG: class I SAM-dependent methyltransferase [Bacteriovoracaceae bacterium]